MIFKNKNLGLGFLSDGAIPLKSNDIMSFMKHNARDQFNKVYNSREKEIKANVRYLSKPFIHAFEKARASIADYLKSAVWGMKNDAGVLIVESDVVVYSLVVGLDRVDFFIGAIHNGYLALAGTMSIDRGGVDISDYWVSQGYNGSVEIVNFFALPLGYLAFMQFAETETQDVEPRKKKKVFGEKLKNDTGFKIRVVGCEWYTTLVRSEGFDVRGHFRLQPFGRNMEQRKLIWINPFKKHGYTRRAQIIINERRKPLF